MRHLILTVLITVIGFAIAAMAGSGGNLRLAMACAVLAFGVQWLAFLHAWFKQTEAYFDLCGSLTYMSVVAMAYLSAGAGDTRSMLMALCVMVWAARLGSFLFLRIRADGGDRRFDKLKTRFAPFLMTWTLQGLWVTMTVSCVLAALLTETPRGMDA